MAAVPISIRLPERTVGRLADRADRSNMPSRTLAQRYVEEGLRMDDHPLIRFADGPSGRRARLLGGPDVWEVVAVARDNERRPRRDRGVSGAFAGSRAGCRLLLCGLPAGG